MSSSKEQIHAEALNSFRTVEAAVGAAKIVLRELSVAERRQLDACMFEMKDGEFVTEERVDKDGKPYKGNVIRKDFSHYDEHWIAATATPAFTVEELIPWPNSLKASLGEAARKVNGIEPAETTAKN